MALKSNTYILVLWLIILFIISIIYVPIGEIGRVSHIDKLAHFVLYGITALIFLKVLILKLDIKKSMLSAFLLSSIYGSIVEFIQSFTSHRSFELADILTNCIGALTFVLGFGFYAVITRKKTDELSKK